VARRELEDIAESRKSPIQEIRRARALLLAADGLSNVEIAEQCGFTPRTIASLRMRFRSGGIQAVRWDRRGRVPPVEIPSELVHVLPDGVLVVNGIEAEAIGLYLGPAQRAIALEAGGGSDPVVVESRWGSHRQFLSFLKILDRQVNRTHDIYLLLDRWPGHVDQYEVDRWLSNPRRSRFHLHFIPSPIVWQRVANGTSLRQLTRRNGNDVRSMAALARI
jgi:hypothetical protein